MLGTFNPNRSWTLLAVVLASVGALVGVELLSANQATAVQEESRLRFVAEALGRGIETQVDRSDRLLRAVTEKLPEWRDPDGRYLRASRELSHMNLAFGGHSPLQVLDANGIVIASDDETQVGQSFVLRDFFLATRVGHNPRALKISHPFQTPDGAWAIALARPRFDNAGHFSGAVASTFQPQFFDGLAEFAPQQPDLLLAVIHADGVVFKTSPSRKDLEGKSISGPGTIFNRHRESRQFLNYYVGPWRSTASDDMVAIHTIDLGTTGIDKPLVVVAMRDFDAALADWRKAASIQLALFAGLVLVASTGMAIFHRRRAALLRIESQTKEERLAAEAKLRNSHARLDGIVNAALEAVISIDANGKIVLFSNAAESMFSCSRDDALGTDIERFIPERFRVAHRHHIADFARERIATRRMGKRHNIIGLRSNGEEFPIEAAVSKIECNGEVMMNVVMTDVSEIRARELALKTSEQRFRDMVETTDGIVWEADAVTFGFTYVSHKAERLLGFPIEDWYQPGFWVNNLHPGDKDWAPEFCASCTGRLEAHDFEYRFIAKDGRTVWLHDIVTVVPENGAPRWLRGLMIDVTKRKSADQALSESTERLRNAEHMAKLGNWEVDCVTGTMLLSDEALSILETDTNSFNNRYEEFLASIHPEDRHLFDSAYQQSQSDKAPFDIEYRLLMKDRRVKYVRTAGAAESTKEDKPPHVRGTIQDVTSRQRAAQALITLNSSLESRVDQRTLELNESNLALRGALESLKQAQNELVEREKLASLGSLVAGVAHELNTPLGNGVTICSSLKDEYDALMQQFRGGKLTRSQLDGFLNKEGQGLSLLLSSLERATKIVIDFKQVAVDQSSENRRQFDLQETVTQIVESFAPRFKHTPHRLAVEIPAGMTLDSYPGPLGQVISNLALNALVHAFDDARPGELLVRAESLAEDRIRLQVTDNGRGIPPQNLPRIFEPFFTTRLGHGGSGLGLHLVYNIVTKTLGGQIRAASIPGQGTEFTIDLPCQAPPEMNITPSGKSSETPITMRA